MALRAILQPPSSPLHCNESSPLTRNAFEAPLKNPRGVLRFVIRATSPGLIEKSEAEKSNRLRSLYKEKIVPILMKEFAYKNIHQVPKLEKIVLNSFAPVVAQNEKSLESLSQDIALISGQKPKKTTSRKAVAATRIKKGQVVGVFVTLRRRTMYHFLDRLIHLALPQVRDFLGLSLKKFNGMGGYHFGLEDISVFPEIKHYSEGKPTRIGIAIDTTAKTNWEVHRLLQLMGMPFKEGRPLRYKQRRANRKRNKKLRDRAKRDVIAAKSGDTANTAKR